MIEAVPAWDTERGSFTVTIYMLRKAVDRQVCDRIFSQAARFLSSAFIVPLSGQAEDDRE